MAIYLMFHVPEDQARRTRTSSYGRLDTPNRANGLYSNFIEQLRSANYVVDDSLEGNMYTAKQIATKKPEFGKQFSTYE